MVPALAAIFGLGAAGAIVLALALDKRTVWFGTFITVVIFLHEISFVLLPGNAWVRLDLLISLPVFTLVTAALAWLAFREYRGVAVPVLLLCGAVAGPGWFFLIRDRL